MGACYDPDCTNRYVAFRSLNLLQFENPRALICVLLRPRFRLPRLGVSSANNVVSFQGIPPSVKKYVPGSCLLR